MKRLTTIAGISVLLASLSAARAQTTLTAWTFDNLPIAPNSSPQPSSGFGTAAALGFNNSFNNTNSVSNPDVQSLSGSSSGNPNSWRVRGAGAAPNGGNGWSTNAAIGSQGAQFSASTAGYYRILVSFDVNATPDAEANLLVQYTTEGTIWHNATITSVGTLGVIATNSVTNQTVMGSYVVLTNDGVTGWNNQITVDLSGVSGVDNNPGFGIRIVNASKGTNCVDTTGALYNNTSGSWTFDNVVVQGVPIDTIAGWTFESYGTTGYVPNPVPEFSVGNTTLAKALGFDTSFHFADGSIGSTNDPDTLVQGGSSTPTGTICWRVRGQGPGNGWFSGSGTGTQGAEFDVSTLNFTNIIVSFDLYFTSQAQAKMQVEYTVDGTTWFNATNLYYAANPTFILTNAPSNVEPPFSADTVTGTYFYQTTGQNWYNNLVVDLTGVAAANNNPNFGIRVVNAAQNGDCTAFNGGSYNNSSGNCRFDNVTVGGHFDGLIPPVIAYDPNATVDNPFTNTFVDDANWRASITSIFVNGSALPNTAFSTNTPGQIVFTPAATALLQSSGTKSLVFFATGYSSDKITQPLAAGVATQLAISAQPAGPSASGGTLTVNPALAVTDKYGNGSTNPYANVSVTATVGSGNWSLGGAAVQAATNGFMSFTNLTATNNGVTTIGSANIKFTVTGYGAGPTNLTSSNFSVGLPPAPFTPGNLAVLQIDTVSNNTTFSMIEVKPSAANQTTPVNIVPISATGPNALRQTSAGSSGRLALSDDGTLLCFAAFADGSSTTPDETLVLPRGVGAMNYSNVFTEPATYTSLSLGGSQARAACTVDDLSWLIDDKGGLYFGQGFVTVPNINALNNVVVRSFGGTLYVETQKTANGSPIPVVYSLTNDPDTDVPDISVPNNLGTDPIATDFYLVSTNAGTNFDIMYIMDQVSSSQGIIKKYSRVPDSGPAGFIWQANGSYTNGSGGDGLFACTNGVGSIYLYYTTGSGGTAGNSIVRLTDANTWNQPISITSSNAIYTASKTTSIKGLTFVPQQAAYTNEVIPPPVLVVQTFAATNAPFTVTNSPDDPAWRAGITDIAVNGTLLSHAAYTLTPVGIVFDPSQSALLQTPGAKSIVIAVAGFSTNSVTQVVAGVPAKLAMGTQPKAPAADGSKLGTQPAVVVQDASGNPVFSTATITAAPVQATWVLGGNTNKNAANGTATFSGLTAFSTASVTGATIKFTASGLSSVTSGSFNIPAPVHSVLKGTTLNGTNLTFTFTNFTGLSYSVLSTNDISAPLSNWPVVGAPVESPSGSGNYIYTNLAATNSVQFYYLRQP
jgi:hypothetical protein